MADSAGSKNNHYRVPVMPYSSLQHNFEINLYTTSSATRYTKNKNLLFSNIENRDYVTTFLNLTLISTVTLSITSPARSASVFSEVLTYAILAILEAYCPGIKINQPELGVLECQIWLNCDLFPREIPRYLRLFPSSI